MKQYKDWAPTAFDTKGLNSDKVGADWYVLPVSRTRDSGPFYESNFETALNRLGGEGDNVTVHRFGHWGPGWVEIITVRPDTPEYKFAEHIEKELEDYPILDEEDYSNREWEAAKETWKYMDLKERVKLCQKHSACIFAARDSEHIPVEIDYFELIEE